MSCDPVERLVGPVAVVGAGTMGHGIAHVCAMAGFDTRLYDVDAEVRGRS